MVEKRRTPRQLRSLRISKPIRDALSRVRPDLDGTRAEVGIGSFLVAVLEAGRMNKAAGVILPLDQLKEALTLAADVDLDAPVDEALDAVFEDAFAVRSLTGGRDDYIGLRHLIFALFTGNRTPLVRARRELLARIGFDEHLAATQIADYCLINRETSEKLEAWYAILRERQVQHATSDLIAQMIARSSVNNADGNRDSAQSPLTPAEKSILREAKASISETEKAGKENERPTKTTAKAPIRKPRPAAPSAEEGEIAPPPGTEIRQQGLHQNEALHPHPVVEAEQDIDPGGDTTHPAPDLEPGLDPDPDRRPEVPMLQADDPWSSSVEDRSGAGSEAEAFAAMVTATEFEPPLAVGIFGDWGSGKSFFMRLLHDAVDERARCAQEDLKAGIVAAEGVRFFSKVVQIRFNAWHYAETNLWASLVDHVFVCLDKWAEKHKQGSEADQLFDRLATARRLTVEAAEQLVALRREHAQATAKRDEAAAALETRRAELETSTATYFRAAWAQVPIRRRFAVTIAAPGLTLALITAIAVALWLRQQGEALLPGLAKAVSTFATVAVPALVWAWTATKRSAAALRDFNDLVETQVAKGLGDEDKARREAEQRLQAAQAAATEAEERLRRAACDAAEAAHDYHANSGKGRALDFIRARLAKGDYARHLGFIATVRRDFEELSARMKPVPPAETEEARALHKAHVERLIEAAGQDGGLLDPAEIEKLRGTLAEPKGQEPVFERIILYIDDLDRCPPHQVVKVLQAIHLLLTFPLFVVFVAVDVRWLRHSLARQYAGQVEGGEGGAGATASASDYLEKIFQIPYWVRPIDVDGTSAILESRMRSLDLKEQPNTKPPEAETPTLRVEADDMGAGIDVDDEADDLEQDARADGETPAPSAPSLPPPPPQPRPGSLSLRLTENERKFIQAAAALLDGSPRRTLRFLNTYRIIKGSLPPREAIRLERGGYRALLTMLSIAVSIDDCYPALLRALAEGKGSPLQTLRNSFKRPSFGSKPDRARVQRALDLFAQSSGKDVDLPFYAQLAARYSFNPDVRVVGAAPADEAPPQPPAARTGRAGN